MCNIHAREVITAEVCIDWAQKYSSQVDSAKHIILFYIANLNRQIIFEGAPSTRKS